VWCLINAYGLEKYKLSVFKALSAAYLAKKKANDEEALRLQRDRRRESPQISPSGLRSVVQNELKRLCVGSLQDPDNWNSFDGYEGGGNWKISAGSGSVAEIVSFLEQAFEWEQMMWHLYPYFWGHTPKWGLVQKKGANRLSSMVLPGHDDPEFAQFMNSGYARVVVPVRVGFTDALHHFLSTGELWAGGALPIAGDASYLPIAVEIAESLQRPEAETPYGAAWTYEIPTTLIRIRKDDRLPSWVQNSQGDWVEK
jgi:hypothetical protein